MKIRHIVETTVEEVDGLFNPVMAAALASYPSAEEQAIAMVRIKEEFKSNLDHLLPSSLTLGKTLGKFSADSKDDIMYGSTSTT